jgi:hypothetical protein
MSTLFACLILSMPNAARAQAPDVARDQQAGGRQQPQALVLQPVKSGWVIAPDVQVTTIDNATRTLFGAYGGWQADERLLFGVGGYWLPDRSADIGMAYAGGVIGWTLPLGERLGVNARALVGGGEARVPVVAFPVDFDSRTGARPPDDRDRFPFSRRFRFRQGFGVAEPQVGVVLHLTRWMAVNASGGYRFIGWAHGQGDQLRGAVGSLSLRFGAWS